MSARRFRREVAGDRMRCATSSSRTTGTPTATRTPTTCRPSSATTTAGRIGMFLRNANPGASETELLRRDRLAHALMYFSRGNPVIYYGDEQGFTGAGGDQAARQDMFPSQDLEYDNEATTPARTTTSGPTRRRWTTTSTPAHPLYRRVAAARARDRALPDVARRRAAAPLLVGRARDLRVLAGRAGASTWWRSTTRRSGPRRPCPTYMRSTKWEKVFGRGPDRAWSGSRPQARRHAAGAVGRRLPREGPLPRSHSAPSISLAGPGDGPRPARGRRAARQQPVRRGDVPGEDRQGRLEGHRDRRQRALPRVPRRLRHRAGHVGPVPRGRARQRRPHALEPCRLGEDRAAGDRAPGAVAGQSRARHRRGPCDRDAGPRRLRRDVPALGQRRPVHGRRHGRLLARLHGVRRHVEPGRRRARDIPRRAEVRARQDGHERRRGR